jgi:hypothetical protein
MTAKPKRLLAALCILIVISLGLYSFVITSGPRYRAETTLFVWTPTNGSFARSFPQELAKTVPGIIRLEMFPGRITTPSSSTKGYTFRVTASGESSDKAEGFSRLAAIRICLTLSDYGSLPVQNSFYSSSHKVSLMTDCIHPWLRSIQAKFLN